MHTYVRWAFALALLPMAGLPLAGCTTDRSNAFAGTVPQPTAAAVTTNAQDSRFINAVGPSDQFEMQTSQVVLQKSRNAAVRAFAQQMIDQHGASTQQLTQLAAAKGSPLSQGLDPTQQRLLAAVNGAGPRNVDRTYLNGQVLGHTATLATYKDELQGGMDPDVKAFAQQNMPMIQQHLQEAQRLSRSR